MELNLSVIGHELGLYLLDFIREISRGSANPIGDLIGIGQGWLDNKGYRNLRLTNVNVTTEQSLPYGYTVNVTLQDTNQGSFVLQPGNPYPVFSPYKPRLIKPVISTIKDKWGDIWN